MYGSVSTFHIFNMMQTSYLSLQSNQVKIVVSASGKAYMRFSL
jgi:hypothetical protein